MRPTITEILDLPRSERSKYLKAIPLTRSWTLGVLEWPAIHHIRRIITRNGGVFSENYRYPGVFWVATFRTAAGMNQCMRDMAKMYNDDIRKMRVTDEWMKDERNFRSMLVTAEGFAGRAEAPVFQFEKDVAIYDERRIERLSRPLRMAA